MGPNNEDVRAMVSALFAVLASTNKASRRSADAGTLRLLQVIAGAGSVRPSDVARALEVSASRVTRQLQELEARGCVEIAPDPDDSRARQVRLTAYGGAETARLTRIGVARFAEFVQGWEVEDVHTLTSLLVRLERSKQSRRAGPA